MRVLSLAATALTAALPAACQLPGERFGRIRPVWQQRVTASVALCARRDSNPRPSAPEAGGVGAHRRSPTQFQPFA